MQEFDRSSGIGGSDVPAILGVSPHKTITDVWMEKVHHPAYRPQPVSPEMRFGTLLEPVLREAYSEDTGRRVHSPGGTDKQHTHWADDRIRFAHIDGLVEGEGIWEGKVPFQTWRNWQDGPPVYVLAQVQHYLDITAEPWCDVSALAAGLDPIFRTWRVKADSKTQENIRRAVTRFWTNNVLEGTPPEPLPMDLEYPTHKSDLLLVADDRAEELVNQMFAIKGKLADDGGEEARLKEELKGLIGPAAGMVGNGWRIRWKQNKDSTTTDWRLVAAAYRKILESEEVQRVLTDSPEFDTIMGLYTTVKAGARPFVLEEYDK